MATLVEQRNPGYNHVLGPNVSPGGKTDLTAVPIMSDVDNAALFPNQSGGVACVK